MMLSDVVPSICAVATLTPPRASDPKAWKRASSVEKAAFACRVGDDLRRMVLAGADHEVEHAVAVDIAHARR